MTESNEAPRCIHCESSGDSAPLVQFQYRGQMMWICAQHLPLLIHSPAKLADKLPGLDQVEPAEGHHH